MKNKFIPRCENLEGRCLLTTLPLGPGLPDGYVMPAAETAADISNLSLPNISFVVQQQDNCSVLICHVHSPQSWLVSLPSGEGEWTDRTGMVRITLPTDLRTVRLSLNDASTAPTAFLRLQLTEDGSRVLQQEWENASAAPNSSAALADSAASPAWSALPRTLLDDRLSATNSIAGLMNGGMATGGSPGGSHGDSTVHGAEGELVEDHNDARMIHTDNSDQTGSPGSLASIGRLGTSHTTSMSPTAQSPFTALNRLAPKPPSSSLDQASHPDNSNRTNSDSTATENSRHPAWMETEESAGDEAFPRLIPRHDAATDTVLAQLARIESHADQAVSAAAWQPSAATPTSQENTDRELDEIEVTANPLDARWQVLGASLATVALLGGAYSLERKQRSLAVDTPADETPADKTNP
ncbi:MAG: hypothetical protein ACKOBW_01080 [Planctomycetota bacterium]